MLYMEFDSRVIVEIVGRRGRGRQFDDDFYFLRYTWGAREGRKRQGAVTCFGVEETTLISDMLFNGEEGRGSHPGDVITMNPY